MYNKLKILNMNTKPKCLCISQYFSSNLNSSTLLNSGSDQLGGCRERHQSVWTSCDNGRVSLSYTLYLKCRMSGTWVNHLTFSFAPDPTLWSTWTLPSSSITMVKRRELWISIRRWRGKSTYFETAVATLNLILRYLRSCWCRCLKANCWTHYLQYFKSLPTRL